MILFRARQWGAADWTTISVADSDEDSDTESLISSIIGSSLSTSSLHVQRFDPISNAWEDLE